MCNGVRTPRRSHTETDECDRLCRLRHYNRCICRTTTISNLWRHADGVVRPSAILHDVLSQVSCHGDQHCILVLSISDASVYAHIHHRQNSDSPGIFEDCKQGRIRLMTALAPAHAHAVQAICGGRRAGDILVPRQTTVSCQMFAQPHALQRRFSRMGHLRR